MRKFLTMVLLIAAVLIGCGGVGRLDQGIIDLGAKQSNFIRAWGLPDRQYVKSSDEFMSAGWSGSGGGFFKGKRPIEVWVYGSRKTELAFSEKRRLIGYKTPLSRQELQDTFVGEKK